MNKITLNLAGYRRALVPMFIVSRHIATLVAICCTENHREGIWYHYGCTLNKSCQVAIWQASILRLVHSRSMGGCDDQTTRSR